MAVFVTLLVLSYVFGAVVPEFCARTMLEVVFPVSVVHRAINMDEFTFAVRLVSLPMPLELVTSSMNEHTVTVSLVLFETSAVFCSILPDLLTVSMLLVILPLPGIL